MNCHRMIRRYVLSFGLLASLTAFSSVASADEPDDASARRSAVDETFAAHTGRDGGLTAAQMVARVGKTSPNVAAERANVEQAARELDKTILDFFPKLTTQAKYARLNPIEASELGPFVVAPDVSEGPVPPGSTLVSASIPMESIDNQWSFLTTLSVPISDYAVRLPQAHQVAKHNADIAEHDLRATERGVALETKVLYYNWVKAELAAVVAAESLKLAEEQHERTLRLTEAGAATSADEASGRALVAKSSLLVARSNNLAGSLRAQISVAMHDDAELTGDAARAYTIGEDLSGAWAVPKPLGSQAALARRAMGARPEVASALARVDALETQAEVARSQSFPRLDGFAMFGASNPDQRRFPQTAEFHRSWQVGLQLTFSPNDVIGGHLGAARAEAQAANAAARATAIEDRIEKEVAEARAVHRDAVASLEQSEAELEAAEESYRARRELFLADRATHIELTKAHDDLLHARLDAVNARIAIKIAEAQLEYAAGSNEGA